MLACLPYIDPQGSTSLAMDQAHNFRVFLHSDLTYFKDDHEIVTTQF